MSHEYSACELDAMRARQREEQWKRDHCLDLAAVELKADRQRIREVLKGERVHHTQKVRAFNPANA